jgi:uncharacterized SAM-binding protein YcdF (DUF218 family)
MFFTISKVLWLFADPFSFIVLLGVIGLALSFGRLARIGRTLCVATVVLLVIACFSPLGSLLLRPLEDRFPAPSADLPPPAGIIVLGGALDQEMTLARHQPTFTALAARLTTGVALARRFPKARLIFTGGTSGLSPNEPSEAIGVRDLWLSLGVPDERMSFETKSRNTWENAIYTRALLEPEPDQTWLLVTSAWHMPRAMGIFRRAGFKVVAYPVDYRTFGDSRDFLLARIGFDQIMMLEYAVHEWIGLVAYHLTGKTDAWFPAP